MKCKNCGTEFSEGVFCPECGTKYEPEIVDTPTFDNVQKPPAPEVAPVMNPINNASNLPAQETGKVKWCYQMWFISLLFWFGGLLFGIGTIAAIVLFALRISKYPDNRKKAWLSFGIQMGIIALFILLAFL